MTPDELPAMCPTSGFLGQPFGRLDQCWRGWGYFWCSAPVDPDWIGLCAAHLEELRHDAD